MAGEHGFEPPAIRLLTLNAHQGFSPFRRRKLLPRLRDALRASGADLVFLQEVGGDHGEDIPQQHYELLADQVWPQHAYGRNAVATSGHQGNALLSKFPIVRWQNVDVSVDGVEPRRTASGRKRPAAIGQERSFHGCKRIDGQSKRGQHANYRRAPCRF